MLEIRSFESVLGYPGSPGLKGWVNELTKGC